MIFDDLRITPDRVVRIDMEDLAVKGTVNVVFTDRRTQYCDDYPYCNLEHKVDDITVGATITPDDDFWLAMAQQFTSRATTATTIHRI